MSAVSMKDLSQSFESARSVIRSLKSAILYESLGSPVPPEYLARAGELKDEHRMSVKTINIGVTAFFLITSLLG